MKTGPYLRTAAHPTPRPVPQAALPQAALLQLALPQLALPQPALPEVARPPGRGGFRVHGVVLDAEDARTVPA